MQIEIDGFLGSRPSLFCGNAILDSFVQVTEQSVRLIDTTTFALLSEYVPESPVTVAAGNQRFVVIACAGCAVAVLEVESATRVLTLVSSAKLDQDVACISLGSVQYPLPQGNSSKMEVEAAEDSRLSVVALGMWTDNSLRVHNLPTLKEVSRTSLAGETQIRDVLIVELELRSYLMIGLGDGNVLTYVLNTVMDVVVEDLDRSSNTEVDALLRIDLSERRRCMVGTLPISFHRFRSSEELCVLAACDRPTIIYSRNRKLLFAVLNTTKSCEITGLVPFHSEIFPDCLALTSASSLMIGTVEDIQKLHVQTIHLGECARRIAYSHSASMYAGSVT